MGLEDLNKNYNKPDEEETIDPERLEDGSVEYPKLNLSGRIQNSDIADDAAIPATKLSIPLKLEITQRQGSSATVWGNNGTTNYTVTTAPTIQVGSNSVAATAGYTTITYPTAFTGIPIVFVTLDSDQPATESIVVATVLATTFRIWHPILASGRKVSWMAIGI